MNKIFAVVISFLHAVLAFIIMQSAIKKPTTLKTMKIPFLSFDGHNVSTVADIMIL